MINNERGSVIVVALMVLVLLTIIGIASNNIARTEVAISFNNMLHHMNFYGADSAFATGPVWAEENVLPVDDPDFDPAAVDLNTHTFSNMVSFDTHIEYVDPTDPNHYNYISNMPDIRIQGKGTHPRGGNVKLEQIWVHAPLFDMPDAALRVHSKVNGNGVSGSISGNDATGECEDVPGIAYDMLDPDGNVDYNGTLTGNPAHTHTGELYPMSLFKDNIIRKATQVITPDSNGKVAPDDVITSADDPGIVVIDADAAINNLTGYGVLYIEGTLDLAGNLDWHGIILTENNLTFSGGGNKVIYGSVVSMGDAMALNGSVDIQYDCQVLQSLYDEHSGYKPTPSWRYI